MFLNEADRLAFIQGLGGQLVHFADRSIYAVFESESAQAALSGLSIETVSPLLDPCRTTDLAGLTKDAPVRVGSEEYRIKRFEHDAGSGMSRVVLRR
jgi:hypothetical protein